MKKISLKRITIDYDHHQISIFNDRYDIESVMVKYSESSLFSYLEIKVQEKSYLIRGLKSIWEHLNLSTYDGMEKSEDNKVYDLFQNLSYLKKNHKNVMD